MGAPRKCETRREGRGCSSRRRDRIESQRLEERDERIAIAGPQRTERIACTLPGAAVPQDRFRESARATVVKKEHPTVDALDQPEAPQRRCAPFAAGREEVGTV